MRAQDLPEVQLFNAGLKDRCVLVCGPVIYELLQGASSPLKKQFVEQTIDGIMEVPVEGDDWRTAGDVSASLHPKKVKPLDCLISVVADRIGVPVLTLDSDFKLLPAEVYKIG